MEFAKTGGRDLTKPGHHAHRALMTKFEKTSAMPNVYQAETVFWNHKTGRQYTAVINMLLISEILDCIIRRGRSVSELVDTSGKPLLEATKK